MTCGDDFHHHMVSIKMSSSSSIKESDGIGYSLWRDIDGFSKMMDGLASKSQ
nr:MAG TPA: hypothetical protein [Caudoviricetes sp.]